jgi:hypothetical protein
VNVSGEVEVDPLAIQNTATAAIKLTLPIASNFTATCQCSGVAALECGNDPAFPLSPPGTFVKQVNAGRIYADITNDQAIVEFRPISTDLFKMSVIFTYQIITGMIPGEG